MPDLVEQLRESAARCAGEDRLDLEVQHQIENEAADEISRLRTRLDQAESDRESYKEQAIKAQLSVCDLSKALDAFISMMRCNGSWRNGCFYYFSEPAPELHYPLVLAGKCFDTLNIPVKDQEI